MLVLYETKCDSETRMPRSKQKIFLYKGHGQCHKVTSIDFGVVRKDFMN